MVNFFATDPNVSRSIAAHNEGLSREAMARIQAAADTERAQIAAQAQQRALQQNAQQQQWINALRQQELQQQARYQQGQLQNEASRYQAMIDQARAERDFRAGENEKDRQARLDAIAAQQAPKLEAQKAADDDFAMRVNSFADTLNRRDALQTQALDIGDVDSERKQIASRWLTSDSGAQEQVKPRLSGYFAGQPIDFGAMPYDDALSGAKTNVQSALQTLNAALSEGEKEGLRAYVAQGPDGKWVSRIKAAPGASPAAPAPSAGMAPDGASYFGGDALPKRTAQDHASTNITVRLSDGTVQSGPASNWAALKQRDPGATQVAPGSAPGRPAAPPPAEVTPAPFQQNKLIMPAAAGVDMLRNILKGPNGNTVDIGKAPLSEMFGWGVGDVPKIASVIQAAENGQPLRDKYGNTFNLTPEQIKQAKEILQQIAQ
jgi:hypothetical protein